MKEIKTFENFQPEGKTEKFTISTSSTLTKSDWFGRLTADKKKLMKKLAGTEVLEKPEMTPDGFMYIVKTGDDKIPTLEIPKRFLLTY